MYPGVGAPYDPSFTDVRATIAEMREIVSNGTIVEHPEGGQWKIEGYERMWLLFGRVAGGLMLKVQSEGQPSATLMALNEVMWAIVKARVMKMPNERLALVDVHKLVSALGVLERTLP